MQPKSQPASNTSPPRPNAPTSKLTCQYRSKNCDDAFLALVRDDSNFYLALLDVENGIRVITLRKNDLVLVVRSDTSVLASLSEVRFWFEWRVAYVCHDTMCPYPSERATGLL